MRKVSLFLIFAAVGLMAGGTIFAVRLRRVVLSSDKTVSVSFCDLARHREQFWDLRIDTSAELFHGVEGSGLVDPACPDELLLYNVSLENREHKKEFEDSNKLFSSPIRIAFEGKLSLGSVREDWRYRALRAVGIKTKNRGILTILHIINVDKARD